jgi:pimeloyl-ACP methyl ester carboxylesterase
LREQIFDTGVVRINYAEGPPMGSPLLLLHGYTGRWQGFLPLLPLLCLNWHVYAPDYRGHGKSGRVPRRYGAEDYMGDIQAFAQGVVKEPAAVFGHSLGALFALALAGRTPQMVRAVIVGDIALSRETWAARPHNEEYWKGVRDLAASEASVPELTKLVGELPVLGMEPAVKYKDLPEMTSVDFREWARSLTLLDPGVVDCHAEGRRHELLEAFDFEALLRAVSCPVLLLQGETELGALMTANDVQFAMSVLPDAYHVKIGNVGHDLGLGSFQVTPLLRAAVNFLESL